MPFTFHFLLTSVLSPLSATALWNRCPWDPNRFLSLTSSLVSYLSPPLGRYFNPRSNYLSYIELISLWCVRSCPTICFPLCRLQVVRCKRQGSREDHALRVLSLWQKLGSRPWDGHFLRPLPVQKTFKMSLQRKTEAQALNDSRLPSYRTPPGCLGTPLSLISPTQLTYHVGIRRGPYHPSKCHSWGCRPQGAVAYCPSIYEVIFCLFLRCDPT